MAVLAYCITDAEAQIDVPKQGLQGKKIEDIVESGLRCYISNYTADDPASKQPVREAALAFNRILQTFLRQTAIIPLRYPTVLADANEVSSFLRDHAGEYRDGLSRIRDGVQMEIRLSSPAWSGSGVENSGAEYLRARQAHYRRVNQIAEELYKAVGLAAKSYKIRQVAEGARCFFLVDRAAVDQFVGNVRSAKLPADVGVRVSGPWPATEFLKED
jgi:hypothetical protein